MTKASQRANDYEAQLRSAGVRMTKQRLAILRVLAKTDSHPDANEIFHVAFAVDPSISLSTVYRTMRILEERGAIQRHAFDDGRARFEHATVSSTIILSTSRPAKSLSSAPGGSNGYKPRLPPSSATTLCTQAGTLRTPKVEQRRHSI